MKASDRIIVALDVDTLDKVKRLMDLLVGSVSRFKVGLELMTAVGAPQVVRFVHSLGGSVFFDGKFDDIPEQVAGASQAASNQNVSMFTVHASAGIEAMQAAVANKGLSRVLAVTVLTSLGNRSSSRIFGASSATKVLEFARNAKNAKCDGVVCSPQELLLLGKHKELNGLDKVTPGIRPVWADKNDHMRTMTPAEAMRDGATALVIGRPITAPPAHIGMPRDAVRRIIDEIEQALQRR